MFGNNSIKQIQQMQQRLMKVQEELANETVDVTAGGGVITVTITGNQQVRAIKIDPEAVDPQDVSMLEDLIVAAVNEAIAKSQDLASRKMSAVTGNLRIPGM
jgi:nucleoid-associated protein EbfC